MDDPTATNKTTKAFTKQQKWARPP